MKKVTEAGKWLIYNFFTLSIVVFIIIYLRWFRLTPLMLNGHNDSDGAYVFGLILLILYGVSGVLPKLSKRHMALRIFLCIPAAFFLFVNILHVSAYFPLLENDVKCNGVRYYVTWGHPFGDYQWTNYTRTKWENITYETSFFGYTPSAGPYEIICDEERKEANFIRTTNDVLVYTDGKNPRRYDQYAGIELNGYQYFLAWQCNNWSPSTCESETYTLYQCEQGFKSCDPLPLQYTTKKSDEFFVFESNETINEISLYDDFDDNPGRVLIFTYGKHPRCYVEGCEILEKQ